MRKSRWYDRLFKRKGSRKLTGPLTLPTEGSRIRIEPNINDKFGRRMTRYTIFTNAPVPGGDVWKRSAPKIAEDGSLVIEVPLLKTVKGKEGEVPE